MKLLINYYSLILYSIELILNQGTWEELKTKFRNRYPQLTETNLQHKEGME